MELSFANTLKQKIAAAEVVVGTWVVMPCATSVEVIATAGFDFVIIDQEHGPHGLESAENMIRAAEGRGCTPLIRVPGVDESAILRALDTGAHGVVVPQIQSEEQAAKVLEYALYPPLGKRGHSPFTRAGGFTHVDASARMELGNLRTFIGLLIEGPEGISALPEILERHGALIDLIYVGVYDLASVLGHRGKPTHPEVEECIAKVATLAQERGVTLGVLANTTADLARYVTLGARLICFQNDTGILHEACKAVVSAKNGLIPD